MLVFVMILRSKCRIGRSAKGLRKQVVQFYNYF